MACVCVCQFALCGYKMAASRFAANQVAQGPLPPVAVATTNPLPSTLHSARSWLVGQAQRWTAVWVPLGWGVVTSCGCNVQYPDTDPHFKEVVPWCNVIGFSFPPQMQKFRLHIDWDDHGFTAIPGNI